jgi:two-component system response regulator DevR
MSEQHAKSTRVFVVEDSAPVRARLLEMLRDVRGVAVVGEADSAAGAIEGIERTRPDAVVLDIHLVGGSGLEVLRKVHPLARHVVFIVLTNHPEKHYRDACLREGASHFLDKTSEFARVKDIVAGLGEAQRAAQ